MQRLVCVVEGKGEVQAIPNLCARILILLGATAWFVDKEPIRRPRSQLVDERIRSPKRLCREEGIKKALALAAARKPNAVLVLCDSDDDCPGVWSTSVMQFVFGNTPTAAVMAVREFEGWLLWSFNDEELARIKALHPEKVRDAKRKLEKLIPGYKPTTHQLDLTRQIGLERLREHSDSFDKLVRTIGSLCRIAVPPRQHG